jgi:hypothetical protein
MKVTKQIILLTVFLLPVFRTFSAEESPNQSPPQTIALNGIHDSAKDTADIRAPEFPSLPFDTDHIDSSGAIDSSLGVEIEDTAAQQEISDSATKSTDTTVNTLPDTAAKSPTSAPPAKPVETRPAWLYPGLTIEQHQLAMKMLYSLYNYKWADADKIGRKMQKIEKKKNLPPLSYLLLVGMQVMRIQRGEYANDGEKRELLAEIGKLSSKGIELADPDKCPDSNVATNLFIIGGIKGFKATLDIEHSPINAAMSGFGAVKSLQKALNENGSISDAWLGLGLFNCILAKASFVIRSGLSIIGKNVSYSRGLTQLRTCAYHGYYASDIAKLYLVEFLSPYMGDQTKEKQAILRSLEKSYPQNPYFLFLDLDENLCFHEKVLSSFSYSDRIRRQISKIKPVDRNTRRYANLLKWQYLMIDPFPSAGLAPDTTMDMGDFAYYPIFLKALREKISYENDTIENKSEHSRHLHFVKKLQQEATDRLENATTMPASVKNYYLWHIRDALRIKEEK